MSTVKPKHLKIFPCHRPEALLEELNVMSVAVDESSQYHTSVKMDLIHTDAALYPV